jgi:hypothetical protein
MRIRSIGAVCLGLGLWLVPLSNNAQAQFGPAGTDTTQSLGQFSIVVNPAFSAAVQANYGANYNAGTNIFTSPLLYDAATQIDRSNTTTVGSAAYNSGMTVGSPANGTVTPAALAGYGYPAGYTPAANEDTVFTQIHTFDLASGGFGVLAGAAAQAAVPGTPASIGEVVSNATGAGIGNPSNDFPAKSFFDVFVDIQVPGLGSSLTNPTPLMVENPAITSFPPVVIYTHGNSSAVQVELGAGNVFGEPAGTVFGVLTLAGHGAGYGQNGSSTGQVDENNGQVPDATNFENEYDTELATPSDLLPLPDVDVTTPGFGTSNEESWSSYVPDVPEPSSLSLLAVGVVAAGLRNRGRRKASEIPME